MLERAARRCAGCSNGFPSWAWVGPRQAGKTTLARELARTYPSVSFFDLEDPADRARLADPMLALRSTRGLVIIDEVHHAPGLFESLRVLADRPRRPARFLVLGSASPNLLRQSAETLAGRIGLVMREAARLQPPRFPLVASDSALARN